MWPRYYALLARITDGRRGVDNERPVQSSWLTRKEDFEHLVLRDTVVQIYRYTNLIVASPRFRFAITDPRNLREFRAISRA